VNWIKKTFEISHANHRPILAMEGIRGFAVFLVFLVHYATLVEPWVNENSSTYLILEYMRSAGDVGVDLFFVLSGYLIYGMLIRKHKSFTPYLIRRIQRIYPVFSVVFIIYLSLSVIFPAESKIPDGWSGLIYLIQNFLLLPGLFDINAMITVAWSLSYEFFYYLLIPLLIALSGMRSWTPLTRISFFLSASLLAFLYFYIYDGHIRLLMFVSGILLFDVIESKIIKKVPPIGIPALLVAIAAAILFKEFSINGWWKYILLYCLFFIFCLECFISPGVTTRLFSFSPMRWLGNMSYSYYLIHGLALKFIFLVLGVIYPAHNSGDLLFWLLLPIVFFLTLIPSTLLFIYVEKPFSLVRRHN